MSMCVLTLAFISAPYLTKCLKISMWFPWAAIWTHFSPVNISKGNEY